MTTATSPTTATVTATASATAPASSDSARQKLSWQRIALIVLLLNLPAFFNGCGPGHRANFTLGTVVPYAEISDANSRPGTLVAINHWSWPQFALNFALTIGAVWLLCRRFPWASWIASSKLSIATLVIVAAVFNSWLYVPFVWLHIVFTPTWYLFAAMHLPVGGEEGTNPTYRYYALLISSRLYYTVCLVGAGATMWAVRGFLRRYFFVPAGHWWQVQLGGLLVVVLVLGTAIGILARLLMH